MDIKKILGELGFKPEQIDEIAPKFEAGHISALEQRYADPARVKKLAELEELEAELQTRNNQLNTELAEWAQLTAAEKETATRQRAELDASQQEVLRLTQAVSRLATQAGVDPTTVLPKPSETPASTRREPAVPDGFDPSQYVRASDFSAVSSFNLELPSKLLRIAREHHKLTGEDLDTDTIVAEIRRNAGKKDGTVDPIAIWERMHDIPAKRQAKETEQREAELKAAEDRGYERARTDQAMTPTAIPGRNAPIFKQRNDQGQFVARTSQLKRPQPETAVRNAAAALSTGKYKQERRAG